MIISEKIKRIEEIHQQQNAVLKRMNRESNVLEFIAGFMALRYLEVQKSIVINIPTTK